MTEIKNESSFSHIRNNDLQQYFLSSSEQLCCSDSFLFACVQHTFDKKKHNYACVQVTFNQQMKVA